MKWFRHAANGSRDRAVTEAVALFKSQAYMLYYVTIEVISESQKAGGVLGECEAVFDDFLARVKCAKKTALKILDFFKERGTLDYEVRGPMIWLQDPDFYSKVDEYTKRTIGGKKPDRRFKNQEKTSGIRIGDGDE